MRSQALILLNSVRTRPNLLQKCLQLFGQGSLYVHCLLVLGVSEGKMCRVKEVPVERQGILAFPNTMRRSIQAVAHHGMTQGLHMDANLVRPPGLDAYLDQRE